MKNCEVIGCSHKTPNLCRVILGHKIITGFHAICYLHHKTFLKHNSRIVKDSKSCELETVTNPLKGE